MSKFTESSGAALAPAKPTAFYFLAWRWHFYSGLYVVPFLLMLAVTGLVMVYFTGFQNRLGQNIHVQPQAQIASVTAQAKAVLAQFPQATIKEYITQKSPDLSAWVVVHDEATTLAVAVNPYTADVLSSVDKDNTIFAWAEKIHGTLLLGDVGDRLIEIAAGLAVVQLTTGLYLFWPRQGATWLQALVPDFSARGRKLWKSLHSSVGFYTGAILLLFLLTGHAWTGVWGAKFVQPWNSFPAEKWDAPKSDLTHASLNPPGLHEVPWGLEQTPLPASGGDLGKPGIAGSQPVNLDSLHALGKTLGFSGQFHIAVPKDDNGVYTLSADTMSGDLHPPTRDRTVHVDRYTGKILADVGYADYPIIGQAMAVGIALHQGDLGLWNALLNVAFTLAIIFLAASGVVVWWKRRPAKAGRLAAPLAPADRTLWKGGILVMALTGLAFPLAGAAMLAALVLDFLLLSRVASLKTRLN